MLFLGLVYTVASTHRSLIPEVLDLSKHLQFFKFVFFTLCKHAMYNLLKCLFKRQMLVFSKATD